MASLEKNKAKQKIPGGSKNPSFPFLYDHSQPALYTDCPLPTRVSSPAHRNIQCAANAS